LSGIVFWGVIASPFQLKMQALADFAGRRWQRWPDQANRLDAVMTALRLRRAKRARRIERFGGRDADLDEYPAVPFYSLDGRHFFYDSSGLAYHLDQLATGSPPLAPEEPDMRFICQLIDEAFDEFGLYMVHHNRWVISAATNCMGTVTSRELRSLLPPGMRRRVARNLARRQVRRCPYLFSVAPAGFDAGVSGELTPPAREGFPPTHELLDTAWRRYLAAMETVLTKQPYLLGERFTLADASAYGQLGMNLIDGRAARLMEELAPTTFQWLCMIRDGGHRGSTGSLLPGESLEPLLTIIGETFIPLMQQNDAAYGKAAREGQTLFNEAAFDRNEALYDGALLGMPYRAVVKSFQVPVWRTICQSWRELDDRDRERLQSLYAPVADATFAIGR
jgi:glutathione S-transferase